MSVADSSNTVKLHEGITACKEREYAQGNIRFTLFLVNSLAGSILFEFKAPFISRVYNFL